MCQLIRARTTLWIRIFWGKEWSRSILEVYGEATTVHINNIQEWSRCGKSLKQDKLLTFAAPNQNEKAMATQKEMWGIQANNNIK